MNGKVHVAIGVATSICLCAKYPTGLDAFGITVYPWIALATTAAGSYMPDIDQGRTHMGMKHKVASKIVNKVGGGHRGITHTLLFPIIIATLMCLTSMYLGRYHYIASILGSLLFGFETGWCMHIFADLFNGKGCPILWPISKSKISLMDLPSTGAVPWIFAAIFTAVSWGLTLGGIFEWF